MHRAREQCPLFSVEQWARRHSVLPVGDSSGLFDPSKYDSDAIDTYREISLEVNNKIVEVLSADEIADLQTVYYIGRDRPFCEYYEQVLEETRDAHSAVGELPEKVNHLMQKKNFKRSVVRGVHKLGRPDLVNAILNIPSSVIWV